MILIVYNLKYNTINAYWKKINKRVCDKAHSNGMAVLAWFYMGETENNHIYKRLFDYGIYLIRRSQEFHFLHLMPTIFPALK